MLGILRRVYLVCRRLIRQKVDLVLDALPLFAGKPFAPRIDVLPSADDQTFTVFIKTPISFPRDIFRLQNCRRSQFFKKKIKSVEIFILNLAFNQNLDRTFAAESPVLQGGEEVKSKLPCRPNGLPGILRRVWIRYRLHKADIFRRSHEKSGYILM